MPKPVKKRFPTAEWVIALALTHTAVRAQTTYYVNVTCGNDSWTGLTPVCQAPDGPKATIRGGIDAAVDGDTVIAADGVYTGNGNRDLDFGGRLITVRSENGPETCIIDCQEAGRGFIFQMGETPDAVVAGFTITNADPFNDPGGGGMLNLGSSPTVTNCTFSDNLGFNGGGMYNDGSSPVVTDCTFRGNSGAYGGGMYNQNKSSPTITRCSFSGNSASHDGGGMINKASSPTLIDCTFSGNLAGSSGGGMANWADSDPTLIRCQFIGNSSGIVSGGGAMFNAGNPMLSGCVFNGNHTYAFGGGIQNWSTGSVVLTHCTFTGNSAAHGGAVINSGSVVVNNCIFWGNRDLGGADESAQIHLWKGATAMITYTCIQGLDGFAGDGNIGDDPLFVDSEGEDMNPGTEDDNLRLSPDSPCVDAGDPEFVPDPGETDLDGHARVLCGRVDMGAYEFGIGDFDCDRDVDLFDFAEWMTCFTGAIVGEFGKGCEAFDFEADLDVDFEDFGGFQTVFGLP